MLETSRGAAAETHEGEARPDEERAVDGDCGTERKTACFPKGALALRADTTSLFGFAQVAVSGPPRSSSPVSIGVGPGGRYFPSQNFALGVDLYVFYRDNEELKTSGYSLRGSVG